MTHVSTGHGRSRLGDGLNPEALPWVPPRHLQRPAYVHKPTKAKKRSTQMAVRPWMYGADAKTKVILHRMFMQPHPTKLFCISLDRGKSFVPYWMFERHSLLNKLEELVIQQNSYTAHDLLEVTVTSHPGRTTGMWHHRNHKVWAHNKRTRMLRKKLEAAISNNDTAVIHRRKV